MLAGATGVNSCFYSLFGQVLEPFLSLTPLYDIFALSLAFSTIILPSLSANFKCALAASAFALAIVAAALVMELPDFEQDK